MSAQAGKRIFAQKPPDAPGAGLCVGVFAHWLQKNDLVRYRKRTFLLQSTAGKLAAVGLAKPQLKILGNWGHLPLPSRSEQMGVASEV